MAEESFIKSNRIKSAYFVLPDEDGHDYDSALDLAGYGRFHYWLAFICGWANASDAVEILCISFLLPSAGEQ